MADGWIECVRCLVLRGCHPCGIGSAFGSVRNRVPRKTQMLGALALAAAGGIASASNATTLEVPGLVAGICWTGRGFAVLPAPANESGRGCDSLRAGETRGGGILEIVLPDAREIPTPRPHAGTRLAPADATMHDATIIESVLPGVDLVFRSHAGELEYDFELAPGAAVAALRFRLSGVVAQRLDERGDLVGRVGSRTLRQHAPLAYQQTGQGLQVVPSRYRLLDDGSIGFDVADYDRSLPLVIDPIVSFSTYAGGTGNDTVRDAASDAAGSVYLNGLLGSMDAPGLDAARVTNGGAGMVHVTRLDNFGRSPRYTTLVGASYQDLYADVTRGLQNNDRVEGFAVEPTGTVYVAAYATSVHFPETGGRYLRTGGRYVYKLDADGRVVAEFPLDPAVRSVRALAVDRSGFVYVTGTAAPGLRTTPGTVYPATLTVAPFLAKLDTLRGNVVYATYLSQAGQRPFNLTTLPAFDRQTTPLALAVDDAGRAYVTGQATSHFAATPGAIDRGDHEHLQTFVAKLNASASAFDFVARVGGADADRGTGIAVAPDGSVMVVGKTLDLVFPRVSGSDVPVQFAVGTLGTQEIGYLLQLTADGRSVVATRRIAAGGGNLSASAPDTTDMAPLRVAIEPTGNAWITGMTDASRVFPAVAPVQSGPLGASDAFVMRLQSGTLSSLFASTLGGTGADRGAAIALLPDGDLVFAGDTGSRDFPEINAPNPGTGPVPPRPASTFIARISDVGAPIALSVAGDVPAGQPVALDARVAASGDVGLVEFRRSGTLLGAAPIVRGGARLAAVLPPGVHPITARYVGAGPFDGVASDTQYAVVNAFCN